LNGAFRIWASLLSLAIIVQVGLASYGAFHAVDESDDKGTIGKNAVSDGFSAHAGQSALLKWFGYLAPSRPVVALTHGEPRGREPLAELIQKRHGLAPILPVQGEIIRPD